ncbi:beta-lactamase family protein [Flavisolibacter sp. BT320]|nr:beta-lactamase family protein [Flavisolibacter longurius]
MRKLFPAFLCTLLSFCGQAQNDIARFIQQKGDSLLSTEKLPGIFVGVMNGDSRQYFSFGYADPDNKTPFDSSTIFEAGSITKTFTAYVLESVLQEKMISDTTSILPYLPDSVQANKALASISFLSLLNHTSGLPRLPNNLPLASAAPYDNYTAADLFAYLKQSSPTPDGKSNYSNLGAGLAGWLAEKIAGKNFMSLLKTYVFSPFNMKDVTAINNRKAQGYFGDIKRPFWNMDVLFPAGGLQCSGSDLLQYLAGMSQPSSHKRIRSKIVDKLLQPTVRLTPAMRVTRAWHTLEQNGKPTINWHNGGTYGFSTFAAFVNGTKQAVVVVINQFNKNQVSDGLGIAIMRRLLE